LVVREFVDKVRVRQERQLEMRIEVLKDCPIEDTVRDREQAVQITSKSNEIGLELSHGILSQAASAEAYALTEWTDPVFITTAIYKIDFVLSLQAERAKLSIAQIIVLMKNSIDIICQR
jgi:hypothetical protein